MRSAGRTGSTAGSINCPWHSEGVSHSQDPYWRTSRETGSDPRPGLETKRWCGAKVYPLDRDRTRKRAEDRLQCLSLGSIQEVSYCSTGLRSNPGGRARIRYGDLLCHCWGRHQCPWAYLKWGSHAPGCVFWMSLAVRPSGVLRAMTMTGISQCGSLHNWWVNFIFFSLCSFVVEFSWQLFHPLKSLNLNVVDLCCKWAISA